MNRKLSQFFILAFFSIFYFNCKITTAQTDSSLVRETPINIEDSVSVSDTTFQKAKAIPFLSSFKELSIRDNFNGYLLKKKEIDFTDYRFLGNVISYLPFGYLNDLGNLGSVSQPNIYNIGWGNISLLSNNFSINNSFSNSIDLNSFQTESISSIHLLPPTRGFLHGFINNTAALLISTNDSIKSKPITRLRYYQAPNEEGFVDAMFSARVLPRVALTLRLTNTSIDENYVNSSMGSWKFNLKTIYKISDSIFTKVDYYHNKLNRELNGGIDITGFDQSSNEGLNIYSIEYPVVYSNRGDTTTQNNISASIYGKLLPFGFTRVSFGLSERKQVYFSSLDNISNRFSNYYKSLYSTLEHRILLGNFSASINAGYEKYKIGIKAFTLNKELYSYYSSIVLSHSILNKLVTPSVFGKYSYYNSQTTTGLGTDVEIKPIQNLRLLFGYSLFDKPYSILETQYLNSEKKHINNVFFASIEFEYDKFRSTLSYFNINEKNSFLPVFVEGSNYEDLQYIIDNERVSSGINFNTKLELWNILATTNLNYYQNSKSSYQKLDDIFSLNAGLFYVDTLYNNNLNLKTGFIFNLFDNSNYSFYDYQFMRSANYLSNNNVIYKPILSNVLNDKMRVDFYLAGRIQDAATFYFIFENILGNTYYVVPYYPMPEGGMRIGISWDFLD